MEQRPDKPTDSQPKETIFSTRGKRPSLPIAKPLRRLRRLRLAPILAVAIWLLVSMGGGYLGAYIYEKDRTPGLSSTAARQQYVSDESALIAEIAKTTGQSVVSINVTSQSVSMDLFGFTRPLAQESAGTGFIISSSGIIVTNRHVIPKSSNTAVSVTLADGTRFDDVQIIGRTAENSPQDVAFLKIKDLKGKTLVPVTLGDSSKVQVGDRVVAIGNALGQFQNTVTSGIISGYGRDVTAAGQNSTSGSENLIDLFQTDAAINEGNSGGPLVNINGEVIGVNTAIASGAQNIGFAQPINDLKGLIDSVLGDGELKQPYLGVRYVSLTDDIAYTYNLSVKRGAYVVGGEGAPAVVEGSPAEKAGIREKDIIVKVDNIAVDDRTSLTSALSRHKVGDRVELEVVRAGKTITLHATLGAAPSS